MTNGDCEFRVVRDDCKAFTSLDAAGASAYGKPRCGSGIARAIKTGGKAGGHHWRYAQGYEPSGSRRRWTERERWRLATLWPQHGRDWDGWAEALPGRTPDAIEAMARKMGLRPRPRTGAWTRSEEAVILRDLMRMAQETGRTPGSIVARLGHLKTAAKQREGSSMTGRAARSRSGRSTSSTPYFADAWFGASGRTRAFRWASTSST